MSNRDFFENGPRASRATIVSRLPNPQRGSLPAVKHVVFIVRENKHFDEEFGDEPNVDGDPELELFGRTYTPNAHKLAESFTLFDNFMSDGEASIYGHAWTTQGMANDYHERNAHVRDDAQTETDARVASSIWPYPLGGEDTIKPADMDFDWYTDLADLPNGPRTNVSAVFGPRGELIDALARRDVSFRVYGEQMTMLPDGRIAPGLAGHADREYPGAHIDFGVLDTDRARIFLSDVGRHGLAQYSYLTLPTDHTGVRNPAFSRRPRMLRTTTSHSVRSSPDCRDVPTGAIRSVFVTCDDAQGTGDHVDSHRMPAFAIGPLVRRSFVSHTHYSQTSILRTVELLFGAPPLNVYDAAATPIVDAFARQPLVSTYTAVRSNVPIAKNPGSADSLSYDIDGADGSAVLDAQWRSVHGAVSLERHRRYLARSADSPSPKRTPSAASKCASYLR